MESFEMISAQYTPMIYSLIRKLSIYKNKDEFFQIGLIALWEAYQRFDSEKGSFTNYAYTCIKRKMLSELTRWRRDEDMTTSAPDEFWEYVVDEWNACPLEEDLLLSYCTKGKLSLNQTKWVLYSFLKGFTIKEIAEIEQVSLSAVKHWRKGAKENLRKIALFKE